MKTSKKFIVTFCMALICVLASSTISRADTWDHATKLTFSEPVEIPGQVLPAGTYWFTIFDSPSNRNIVQIWNGDRTRLLSTILAIPDYRMQPTDKTVIKFAERPSDSPEAIRSWFYPGANFGQEFVYPKAKAIELAKLNRVPVLAVRDEPASDATVQPPVEAISPSGQELEIAEVVTTGEVAPAPAPPALPQTGSLLPLVGMLGILSLAGGVTLRAITQK